MPDKLELQKKEDKLKKRFYKLSILFIIFTILSFIWIVAVALGIILYDYRPTWALLSLDNWIYAGAGLIAFFIFLDFLLYLNYVLIRKKRMEAGKPKPEYHDGKRVHIYTYPGNAEGGIFSKTYVNIDENNILRLRTLMIPPETVISLFVYACRWSTKPPNTLTLLLSMAVNLTPTVPPETTFTVVGFPEGLSLTLTTSFIRELIV